MPLRFPSIDRTAPVDYTGQMMAGVGKRDAKERVNQAIEFIQTGQSVDNRSYIQKALSVNKDAITTQEDAMAVLAEHSPDMYKAVLKREETLKSQATALQGKQRSAIEKAQPYLLNITKAALDLPEDEREAYFDRMSPEVAEIVDPGGNLGIAQQILETKDDDFSDGAIKEKLGMLEGIGSVTKPLSPIGKLQDDLEAGRISQSQYDLAKPKQTPIAGDKPLSPIGKLRDDLDAGRISQAEYDSVASKENELSSTIVEGFDDKGNFGRFSANDPKLKRAATIAEKKAVALMGQGDIGSEKWLKMVDFFSSSGEVDLEVTDKGIKFTQKKGSARTISAETRAIESDVALQEGELALYDVVNDFNALEDQDDPFGYSGYLAENYGAPVLGMAKQTALPEMAATVATLGSVNATEMAKVNSFREKVRFLAEKTMTMRKAYGQNDRTTSITLSRADGYFGMAMNGDREMFEKAVETMQDAISSRKKFLEAQTSDVKIPIDSEGIYLPTNKVEALELPSGSRFMLNGQVYTR